MKLIKINEEHYVVVDDSNKYILDTKQNLSLQEVKELIGEVDVEKKALAFAEAESYGKLNGDLWKGFLFGYNQALEDNKDKKYTEDDMRKVFLSGVKWDTYKEDEPEYKMDMEEVFNKTIQSIQPKTEWEVEID